MKLAADLSSRMNEMIILNLQSDKKRGEDCRGLISDTCFAQLSSV